MSNKKMTPEDIEASRRLKAIYLDHKANKGETQVQLAERLGMTQSNLAIYINGHQPISLKMLLKLSDALECNCSDIRPEVKDKYPCLNL